MVEHATGLSVRPHHVGISVADLDASIAWYQKFLSFAVESVATAPDKAMGRAAMLVNEGGFRVELFELPDSSLLPDERRDPNSDLSTQGVKHLAYQVDDLVASQDRLRDLGADIVWDLRVHDDVKILFLRDNTGTLVELVEPCGS